MLTYGIDFGTSNTLLGAAENGQSRGFAPLDPDSSQPHVLRSLLYFPSGSEVFYGKRAIEEYSARDQTGRWIRSIKKQLPVRSFVGTYIDQRPMNLEDLIGTFLGEVRRRANQHFQQDVTRVVLGRPARFSPVDADDLFAEGRLERAARIAGFKEIYFFPEPVAAALGYAAKNPNSLDRQQEQIILAADYGGGTSDFTVYRLPKGNDVRSFRQSDVLSMGGVSIAGDAFDSAIMRKRISPYFGTGVQYQVPFGSNILTMPVHLMERICHPGEIGLLRRQDTLEFFKNVKQWALNHQDREKMDRLFTLLEDQLGFPLFEEIEKTKRALSSSAQSTFEFHYPEVEISVPITRAQFEQDSSDALIRIQESLEQTLHAAQIEPQNITQVLCTGGTAQVPAVRQSLIQKFGKDKLVDLDPFQGVAQGLLIRALELAQV